MKRPSLAIERHHLDNVHVKERFSNSGANAMLNGARITQGNMCTYAILYVFMLYIVSGRCEILSFPTRGFRKNTIKKH